MQLEYDTFRMGTDKEAALKPLEEAAEVFGAWQVLAAPGSEFVVEFGGGRPLERNLADEIADCIQACCNLAARFDLDLPDAMERCRHRNRMRGRYD